MQCNTTSRQSGKIVVRTKLLHTQTVRYLFHANHKTTVMKIIIKEFTKCKILSGKTTHTHTHTHMHHTHMHHTHTHTHTHTHHTLDNYNTDT